MIYIRVRLELVTTPGKEFGTTRIYLESAHGHALNLYKKNLSKQKYKIKKISKSKFCILVQKKGQKGRSLVETLQYLPTINGILLKKFGGDEQVQLILPELELREYMSDFTTKGNQIIEAMRQKKREDYHELFNEANKYTLWRAKLPIELQNLKNILWSDILLDIRSKLYRDETSSEEKVREAILTGNTQFFDSQSPLPEIKEDDRFNVMGAKCNCLHYLAVFGGLAENTYPPMHPPYYTGIPQPKPRLTDEQHDQMVAALLQRGANINAEDSFFQQSALNMAIAFDNNGAALALLKHDKEKKLLNAIGKNPLYMATPLILAVQRGNEFMVRELIKNGADVNLALGERFNVTALHWAAIMRLPRIMRLLIQAGANLHVKDFFSRKPIDYYKMDITEKHIRPAFKYTETGAYMSHESIDRFYYPIYAHFNNDIEDFIRIRNQKPISPNIICQNIVDMIKSHHFVLNGGGSKLKKEGVMVSRGAAKVYNLIWDTYNSKDKENKIKKLPEKISKLLKNKCKSSRSWFCLWGGRDETTAKLYREILSRTQVISSYNKLKKK